MDYYVLLSNRKWEIWDAKYLRRLPVEHSAFNIEAIIPAALAPDIAGELFEIVATHRDAASAAIQAAIQERWGNSVDEEWCSEGG
jgi:hypothetical protein